MQLPDIISAAVSAILLLIIVPLTLSSARQRALDQHEERDDKLFEEIRRELNEIKTLLIRINGSGKG